MLQDRGTLELPAEGPFLDTWALRDCSEATTELLDTEEEQRQRMYFNQTEGAGYAK